MVDKEMDVVGWRGPFSGIIGIIWVIFLIAWLAFFAEGYRVGQNIAILIASLLVLILIYGFIWGSWSLKKIPKDKREMMNIAGFKWRVGISIVIPIIMMIFLIYWFYFISDDISWYQNIAIVLIVLLALGAIMTFIWARWGMKHGEEFGKKAEEIGLEIDKKFADSKKEEKK
jgi:hypothetical protein